MIPSRKEIEESILPSEWGCSILVVDDEPLVLWSLAKVLQKAGFRVATANTAEDAALKLRSIPVNLLITDLKLPGENGFGLALKAKEINPACRVMMMTAFGDDAARTRANVEGIECFIDKPINMAEIIWTVKRIMK